MGKRPGGADTRPPEPGVAARRSSGGALPPPRGPLGAGEPGGALPGGGVNPPFAPLCGARGGQPGLKGTPNTQGRVPREEPRGKDGGPRTFGGGWKFPGGRPPNVNPTSLKKKKMANPPRHCKRGKKTPRLGPGAPPNGYLAIPIGGVFPPRGGKEKPPSGTRGSGKRRLRPGGKEGGKGKKGLKKGGEGKKFLNFWARSPQIPFCPAPPLLKFFRPRGSVFQNLPGNPNRGHIKTNAVPTSTAFKSRPYWRVTIARVIFYRAPPGAGPRHRWRAPAPCFWERGRDNPRAPG